MKKSIIIASIVAVVGFGIYQKVYVPKHTFKITQTQTANMPVVVNGVGNVGAKDIYKVGTIYGGKVLDFTVNEGEFIKKGTVVAHIDSVDLKDKIVEAKATVAKLKNDINSLTLDRDSAIATSIYQDEILAKNKKLYKKGAISQLDFEKYNTNAITSHLKVKSLSEKIKSLQNQKIQIESSLAGLVQRYKRYTIVSPIDGYITKKLVAPYQIAMPNQALIEVVNPKDIWIKTYIDTRISGDVKIGDKATIKLRSSEKLYSAKVVNIKPVNNSVTNEREIDVAFDNLPIPFYLEEQAIVNINIKVLKDIIKVPTNTITVYNEKSGVWIEKDNEVQFHPIKIVAHKGKFSATKDLSSNENIVIPNPKNKALFNGMNINIKK